MTRIFPRSAMCYAWIIKKGRSKTGKKEKIKIKTKREIAISDTKIYRFQFLNFKWEYFYLKSTENCKTLENGHVEIRRMDKNFLKYNIFGILRK